MSYQYTTSILGTPLENVHFKSAIANTLELIGQYSLKSYNNVESELFLISANEFSTLTTQTICRHLTYPLSYISHRTRRDEYIAGSLSSSYSFRPSLH